MSIARYRTSSSTSSGTPISPSWLSSSKAIKPTALAVSYALTACHVTPPSKMVTGRGSFSMRTAGATYAEGTSRLPLVQ